MPMKAMVLEKLCDLSAELNPLTLMELDMPVPQGDPPFDTGNGLE